MKLHIEFIGNPTPKWVLVGSGIQAPLGCTQGFTGVHKHGAWLLGSYQLGAGYP